MLAPVNGNLLNGGRFTLVLATATIACSAALAAQATRIQDALAPTPATGSFVAVPTHIHHTGATFGSVGEVYPTVTHTQSAGAGITGSADFRGLVTRGVEGSASFAGYANILAIPASVLGQANFSPASVSVLVDATKIQHGRSALDTAATVTIQAEPLVNRAVVAEVMGASAQLYAESAVNKVGEAYAYFAATGQLQSISVGLVTRPAGATLVNSAETTANATHVKHSQATYAAGGYTVVGEPYLAIGGLAYLTTGASVDGYATRQTLPLSVLDGTVAVVGAAAVRHGSAAAAFTGSAGFAVSGVRTTTAHAGVFSEAAGSASGSRSVWPSALIASAAQLGATGVRSAMASVQVMPCEATWAVVPDVTVRFGKAALSAEATTQASGTAFRMVTAAVAGDANAVFSSTRTVFGSVVLDCLAGLAVTPIANPFSYDPDERTFFRPAQVVDFVRPSQITEFRRLA